jgi:hypothetical protein
MFSELNHPARQPSVYASLLPLTGSQARLEAGIESLLLFRRALPSPTMCRFIPALSITSFERENFRALFGRFPPAYCFDFGRFFVAGKGTQ